MGYFWYQQRKLSWLHQPETSMARACRRRTKASLAALIDVIWLNFQLIFYHNFNQKFKIENFFFFSGFCCCQSNYISFTHTLSHTLSLIRQRAHQEWLDVRSVISFDLSFLLFFFFNSIWSLFLVFVFVSCCCCCFFVVLFCFSLVVKQTTPSLCLFVG